jgi:hypothetical protein
MVPRSFKAIAIRHDRRGSIIRHHAGLGVAGGFLPRVVYGVIRMQLFQLAGENVGVGGRECIGRDISPRCPLVW